MRHRGFPRTTVLLMIVWVFSSWVPPQSMAAPAPDYNKEKEASSIPAKPTAPGALKPKGPADYYKCQRTFTYNGNVYDCDSNVGWDGERLRPILQAVPESVSQLDLYQANRSKVRTAAYIGSAGILLTVLGFLVPKIVDPSNTSSDLASTVRNITVFTGIGVMVGGFTWALRFQRENEQVLSSAIDTYNKAKPERPIQFQITTEMPF